VLKKEGGDGPADECYLISLQFCLLKNIRNREKNLIKVCFLRIKYFVHYRIKNIIDTNEISYDEEDILKK
jgi:hypothetical protein